MKILRSRSWNQFCSSCIIHSVQYVETIYIWIYLYIKKLLAIPNILWCFTKLFLKNLWPRLVRVKIIFGLQNINIYLIRKLHDLFCTSQSLILFQSEDVVLITIINNNDCFDLFIDISVFMGENLFYFGVFIWRLVDFK